MSDFKAKMHQIRFWLGLRPRPHWGSLQRSPDPLAGFKRPTSKGRGTGREGREGERKGGMGRGLIGLDPVTPTFFCGSTPLCTALTRWTGMKQLATVACHL